jgi:hypothetical protein
MSWLVICPKKNCKIHKDCKGAKPHEPVESDFWLGDCTEVDCSMYRGPKTSHRIVCIPHTGTFVDKFVSKLIKAVVHRKDIK